MDQGHAEDAQLLAREALAVLEPRQPGSSPWLAEADEALARALLARGEAAAAQPPAARAAAYWQTAHPGCTPHTRALALLAMAHVEQGDTLAAEQAWRAAVARAPGLRGAADRQLLAEAGATMTRARARIEAKQPR